MQLVTVQYQNQQRWGIPQDDNTLRLAPTESGNLLETIERGEAIRPERGWQTVSPTTVRLLAPIPIPRRNIICLGLNYADHAEEAARAAGKEIRIPKHPVVFTKATTTISGPTDDIILDPQVTGELDWEVELAVIIGRRGRHISEQQAMEHVFGYTVVNDLSPRDLQFRHSQFFLGKSLDGSCPMGPAITTRDSIEDPHALNLSCRVNGVEKQASNTEQMIFRIPRIISILSNVMSLQAGDIIATGTPGGVGFTRTPPESLQDNDVVECEIQGLGIIRNRITSPAS